MVWGLFLEVKNRNPSDAVANELVAFWAPFFLLHLGGADTFTSHSLNEENLWLKQLVALVVYVLAIVFIFLKSFTNQIWVPTLLMFLAATFRNAQQVGALLLRRHESLKSSRGTAPKFDDPKRSEQFWKRVKETMQTETTHTPLPPKAKRRSLMSSPLLELPTDVKLDRFSIGVYGNLLYDTFKGFITKIRLSSEHRIFSREFFLNRTAMEAFKILEMESQCIYEALYTQYFGTSQGVVPFYNVFVVLASFVTFARSDKPAEWRKFDIVLTYILLSAGLAQEFISYARRSVAAQYFLHGVKIDFDFHLQNSNNSKGKDDKKRRWSESVCHINFLDWCLGHHSKQAVFVHKVSSFFGLKDVVDILRLNLMVSIHPLTEYVKQIIFDELRRKSVVAENKETARKVCSQRGDWALVRSCVYKELKWSLGELEYGESLVLWHIATDFCYIDSELKGNDDEIIVKRSTFCKVLSGYMFYLFVLKPETMVSVSGDWKTVFQDTCEQARSFLLTRSVTERSETCEQIRSTYINMPERRPRNNSVLVRACVLAKQLQSLQGNDQWKVMSEVWADLLAFAAFHCEADIHAHQPSQGVELLTLVWLLINHFGFGKQIMEEDAPTG